MHRTLSAHLLLAALLLSLLTGGIVATAADEQNPPPKDEVLVAVAANFKDVQDEFAKRFQAATGHTVESSPGSTGKLYSQIKNGAPFHIFLSADTERPESLEKEGLAVQGSRFTYAVGRLALYSTSLKDVSDGKSALKADNFTHIAIANPDLAPYGTAAVQVLNKLGLWDRVKDRAVYGENIAQTFQFVESGSAELGFVAYSQVNKKGPNAFWLVPKNLHEPIRQDAVLLSNAKDNQAAKDYLEYLRSKEAKIIIKSYGYGLRP